MNTTRTAAEVNCLYVNNTNVVFTNEMHAAIVAGLRDSGSLPEELADMFAVSVARNPDGSPRYVINWA